MSLVQPLATKVTASAELSPQQKSPRVASLDPGYSKLPAAASLPLPLTTARLTGARSRSDLSCLLTASPLGPRAASTPSPKSPMRPVASPSPKHDPAPPPTKATPWPRWLSQAARASLLIIKMKDHLGSRHRLAELTLASSPPAADVPPPPPPPPLHLHRAGAPPLLLHHLHLATITLMVSLCRLCRCHRARLAGALTPEDAHHLFDELLRQATPVPARSLNGLLTALSRAPDTESCRDGPALALALFNRIRREEAGSRVVSSTIFTYGILMNCCCRTRRPELGLALFGRVLRMGLKTNVVVVSTVLKCLCGAKRTDEAVNILLHRMSELGCVADAFSYTIVLKSLCDDSRSQRALDLLQMWEKERGVCSPNVVTYNTVIGGFFKEGEVSKACNLFHEMVQQGVVPNVVTYSLIIDALCKARAMDNAELFLRQMIDKGNGYINKYPTGLFLKDANRLRLELAL
ncbi:hypothetical protein ZWY2020_022534 [Hordeum vulgare]|nr:hypothetical protein ZWY2020_022534 [Hordeum vulgare]